MSLLYCRLTLMLQLQQRLTLLFLLSALLFLLTTSLHQPIQHLVILPHEHQI